MPAEAAQKVEALAAQAQRLMATFARAGYEQIAPAIIQPAGLFLDVVGEALRARTHFFTDPDGEELCLRPDLTVPTCRLHLARHPSRGALQAQGVPRGLMDSLDPGRPQEAYGLVEAHLERAGLELIGTRTLPEIAERLLAEAADARETPLAQETAALIESYTALKAPARKAAGRIETLIRPHKL